jgi:hypothetical protein
MKFIIAIITLLYLMNSTNSLYFHLFRDQEKCFYDEFYSELVVMLRFNVLDKGLTLNEANNERIIITINYIDDKKEVKRFTSNKITGKYSYNVLESILFLY